MKRRETIMREIRRMAKCRANDAVKLAFLSDEELEKLDRLDLSVVTEFRRNSNGFVELKFIDRMAAMQWLAEQVDESERTKELDRALEKGAERLREEG